MNALIEALMTRKGVFQLKARLLKGVRTELQAARDSGLTWLLIWNALREVGYPGAYQNFCRTASSLTESGRPRPVKKNKSLAHRDVVKGVSTAEMKTNDDKTQDKEKPAWQIQREETMARLDREAELNRQREAQLQSKKVFRMTPFVGRGDG